MSTIAVAGGSGGLGRTFIDALSAAGKKVIVLSRSANSIQSEVQVVTVDYGNVMAVQKVLEAHQIGTVISTISCPDSIETELNLIKAADAANTTTRFIPSVWGPPLHEQLEPLLPLAKLKLDVMAALSQTSLEWTRVNIGFFLDYWGTPEVPSYLQPFVACVDLNHDAAAIPGSGKVPVTFTHTTDAAKFVVKLVEMPKWQVETDLVGDKVTWNAFVDLAQKAKGVNFRVVYDSIEKLQKGEVTELPSHPYAYDSEIPKELLQGMLSAFGLWMEKGVFDYTGRPDVMDLNTKFPDIKTLKVEDVLRRRYATSASVV